MEVRNVDTTNKSNTKDTMKSRLNAVGKRKTARVNAILNENRNDIVINKTYTLQTYFCDERLISSIDSIMKLTSLESGLDVKIVGGGKSSQSQALIFALLKLALKLNPEFKSKIKELDLHLGDSRQVERKKIGLKKARKRYPYRRR